ncbi:hypothetical protein [Enterococcus plantarum]|uniref:hypothetical protein n=1 Tax=Enterococcus plantarum TaxID=1077675 RepID=UPI001A8D811A|nr:hypothetical protein [Enterococcus plantarum]
MTTYGEKIAYPKDNYDELLAKSAEIIDLPEINQFNILKKITKKSRNDRRQQRL